MVVPVAASAAVSTPAGASASAAISVVAPLPTVVAAFTALAPVGAIPLFAVLGLSAARGRGFTGGGAAVFGVALGHRRFAAELHAAFFIDAEALDPDFLAHLDDVLDHLDAEVGEFGNVDEAVLAGEEFDEAAKFLNGHHFAFVDLANLGFRGHALDFAPGDCHAFAAGGVDVHAAVVLDVDLATGFLDEALDVLAARADEGADLLGVDLEGDDLRGVFAEFLSRLGKGRGHVFEDFQPGDAGFLERLGQNVVREAAELEVELEPGDAVDGAGEFAVHVAEGVFPAEDIGEQAVFANAVVVVGFGAEADTDAGDGAGERDAGVHEREGAGANGGHGGGAVGLHDLAGDADGVGIGVEREHRFEAALGQRAVANLTPAGAADAAGFADGEIREVVVEDELLGGFAADVGIEILGILGGAEGGQAEGLGFTPGAHGSAL